MNKALKTIVLAGGLALVSAHAFADKDKRECKDLPGYNDLTDALKSSLPDGKNGSKDAGGNGNLAAFAEGPHVDASLEGKKTNGGLDVPMWATLVDKFGRVCAVTYSGADNRAQWPASRIISMQKAYTANSLTIAGAPGIWSTAQLFYPTQPGQFLWGLDQSNPVNPAVVYQGPTARWGAANDPAIGGIPGGNNRFGGGVAIWKNGQVVGAIGVSGDTSCADHNIALRVRDYLVAHNGLTNNPSPADKGGKYADNIIYDIGVDGKSLSGLGHPTCPGGLEDEVNSAITGIDHVVTDEWPTGIVDP